MKKTTAVILAVLGIVLVLGGFALLVREDRAGGGWSSNWSRSITVSEGRTDPQNAQTQFQIDEDGEYQLSLSWLPEGTDRSDVSKLTAKDAGFLTSVVISDAKGRPIFGRSATAVYFDTTLVLEKGLYSMDFRYLTDREEYLEFARTYLCGSAQAELWAEDIDFDSLQKNGAFPMHYEMGVSPAGGWSLRATSIMLGVLLGLCLFVLMLAAITKGKHMKKPDYDERQELERGRAFQLSYFTLLICSGLVFCIDLSRALPQVDSTVLYGFGVFLSIAVYCVYCVWHECYFAMDEKKVSTILALGLIGLINLGIFVFNILGGRLFENGKLTFHALNLLAAALLLVLAAALLIKWLSDRKKAASGSEDGEENEA